MAKIFIIISFLSIYIFTSSPTYGSAIEVCVNAIYASVEACQKKCGDQSSCKKSCYWDETQIVAKCSKIPSHDKKKYCKTQVYALYEECAKACHEDKSCIEACDVGYKAGHKYCEG